MSSSQPSRIVVLAVLVSATAAGPLSMNIFVPSMPGLQAGLHADAGAVQLTLSLYLIAFATAQLFYGPISDRWGRRPVLLGGLGIFIAGTALCFAAQDIGTLIVGRCIQATGACAGMVLGRAIVRDLYDREQAASMIAYIIMAMVVAPMLAPSIGGYLDIWFGWRSGFAFVLVVGVGVAVAVFMTLRETRPPDAIGARLADIFFGFGYLLRIPAFLGYALTTAFTSGVFFAFLGGAPHVMVRILDRPPSEYGLYFIVNAGMYMVANYISGRYAPRIGLDRLIVVGLTISTVSAAVLCFVVGSGWLSPVILFGGMTAISFGQGLTIANTLAGAVSVDPTRAGSASGLAGFFQMGVGAAASYLVGLLIHDSAVPMTVLMLLGSLAASLSFFVMSRTAGRRRDETRT